jgi:hypothetical protein
VSLARALGCASALVCGDAFAVANGAAAQQPSASGITYVIDTTAFTENAIPADADILRLWGAFGSFSARVMFAAGRGRLEILSRRGGPAVFVDGATSSVPLGEPPDYYLFDSTGFVLVHPRAKTYSVFSISGDRYNRSGSREGWPMAFRPAAPHLDTVGTNGFADPRLHGPIRVYWHTDRVPYTREAEIARGMFVVDDAPYGELNVAQWFGASRAFAQSVVSGAAPPSRATLTAAIPRPDAKPDERVPPAFILKRELMHLQSAEIALRDLTLPDGFAEVPWSSSSTGASARRLPDRGRKWRALPSK